MVKVSIDRQKRGITLQRERGSEFSWAEPLIWYVPGSANQNYCVNLKKDTCDCPDFHFRSERDKGMDLETEPCKHIYAVEIEGAHRRYAARKRKAERGAA